MASAVVVVHIKCMFPPEVDLNFRTEANEMLAKSAKPSVFAFIPGSAVAVMMVIIEGGDGRRGRGNTAFCPPLPLALVVMRWRLRRRRRLLDVGAAAAVVMVVVPFSAAAEVAPLLSCGDGRGGRGGVGDCDGAVFAV